MLNECKKSCEYVDLLIKQINSLKKNVEKLEKDFLTGAYIRHKLDLLLNEEYLPKCQNKEFWFYKIALIDVNNLHKINREKGYKAGDELLVSVVNDIKNKMEKQNVSGRIFRIGGDEFLVIYQPYDKLNLKSDKYEVAYSAFNSKETFKKALKDMDSEIIKKKGIR